MVTYGSCFLSVTDDHFHDGLCWWFGVYLEQDSSITVAFDDIPEDGLNSPLRLEKVANEVCCSLVTRRYFKPV